jgi:RND family efflux transporter MFP subunit
MTLPAPYRVPLLALCLSSLSALSLLVGCGRATPDAVKPPPPEVFVALPSEEEYTEFEEFTGRVWSPNSVELKSRVSGYLKEIKFDDGSAVEVDQPLFVIDPRPFEVEVKRAQAAVDQAEAKLQRMHNQLARADKLVKTNAVSQQEYDQFRFDRDESKAALEAAQASLAMANLNLSYTQVTSPIKGRISRRLVDPGNLVEADKTPLVTLGSVDELYVYFDVDERTVMKILGLILDGKLPEEWSLIMKGQIPDDQEKQVKVQISLTDDKQFALTGVIDFVDSHVDPATGTLRARAKVDNKDNLLVPGMFARVRLPIGNPKHGLLVKEEALGSDQGQLFLYVLNAEDEVEYRRVEPGPLINGRRVVQSNLKADERVVVSGLQRVRPGAKVTPNPDPSSTTASTAAAVEAEAVKKEG